MKKKTNKTATTGTSRYTATQINGNCPAEMQSLGDEIVERLKKARAYEAKAEEKAGVELRKAVDHHDSVERLLAKAKEKCDGGGFKAFKAKFCPDRGKTRIYQLIAIGSGKTTPQEIQAATAGRMKKHRAKKKAAEKAAAEKAAAEKAAAALNPGSVRHVTDNTKEQPAPIPTTADGGDGIGKLKQYSADTPQPPEPQQPEPTEQPKPEQQPAAATDSQQTDDDANAEHTGDETPNTPLPEEKGEKVDEVADLEYREFLEKQDQEARAAFVAAIANATPAIANVLALGKKESTWSNLSEEQRGQLTKTLRKLRDVSNELCKLAAFDVAGDAAAASPTKSDGDRVEEFDGHVHALALLIEEHTRFTATTIPTVILQRVGHALMKIVPVPADLSIPGFLQRPTGSVH